MILGFFSLKKDRETQAEFFKFCSFVVTPEDGTLLPNGTYTGSIGLIQQGKVDFKTKADNIMHGEHFFVSNVDSSGVSTAKPLNGYRLCNA